MSDISPSEVAAASIRLRGIVNHTPVITSRTLNELAGNQLFLKSENFQRGGSFKIRGAYNAISQLTRIQKEKGVITHSSGNHAQGVALASKLLGIEATIVMTDDAPKIKRAATKAYGAKIVPCKAIDREEITNEIINETNLTLIHPYDNQHIIAGQGTAAWELFEEVGELDYLFVPVGGGGLISGSALAAASKCPDCKVIGVEPEIAADAGQSWESGEIVSLSKVPNTIADGLRSRRIGRLNLNVMQRYVDEMMKSTEDEIIKTLVFVWQRLKIIVEPSGVVALSPILAGKHRFRKLRIGVILSGGNVDFASLLPVLLKEGL